MFKSFESKPVIGPAVSVRLNNGSVVTPVRQARQSKISSKRVVGIRRKSWLESFRTIFSGNGQFKAGAVYGLVVLFTLGVVSHIFLVNSSAAKGYEMRKIQNSIQAQIDLEHSLEIKTAELSSLNSVDEAAQTQRLVSINNEEFLAPSTITALQTSK